MRWGSRVRSKAFLTIAACRDVVDVVEAVKSTYIPLSLISAARHPLHQANSLLFFVVFSLHVKKCFLKFLSLTLSIIYQSFCFSDFFASIVLRNKKIPSRKSHFFSLFISLFLFSFFFSLLFLLMSCQGDLMADDKTRHQEKWVKVMVRMATKIWKGGLLLAWFEHDWSSELMDQNLPMKMRRF